MRTLPDFTAELRAMRGARTFIDHVRSLALHREGDGPLRTRASVPLTDDDALRNGATEYVRHIQKRTVLGAVRDAALVVPAHTPIADLDEASISGGFVADGAGIPVTAAPVTDFVTESTKLATMIAFDRRTLELAPNVFERALANVIRYLEDTEFLSATAAVPNVRPAGVLNGLAPVGAAATSLPDKIAAVAAAVSGGQARALYLVTSPAIALAVGAVMGGASGGTIANVPIVTSPAAGAKIIGIDAGRLVLVDESIEVTRGDATAIEMRDDPIGSSLTPAGATLIAMFQTNAAALRVVRRVWWRLTAADAAAYAEVA